LLTELTLEHFADEGNWTSGRYDYGNGAHCLIDQGLGGGRNAAFPPKPICTSRRLELIRRRDKAALSSGCKPHPAIRSSRKQPEQA